MEYCGAGPVAAVHVVGAPLALLLVPYITEFSAVGLKRTVPAVEALVLSKLTSTSTFFTPSWKKGWMNGKPVVDADALAEVNTVCQPVLSHAAPVSVVSVVAFTRTVRFVIVCPPAVPRDRKKYPSHFAGPRSPAV